MTRRNHNASCLDLYDLPYPGAPRHVQVQYAVDRHREGVRPPFSADHVDT